MSNLATRPWDSDTSLEIDIPVGKDHLKGMLVMPRAAEGIVLFSHGSGSGRKSPRNRFVSDTLNRSGLGTLLLDLLTPQEEKVDAYTAEYRFNIQLLSKRVVAAVDYTSQEICPGKKIGLFGASTGAASALIAAAERPEAVQAVVSRGGRPDLAGIFLRRVHAPTLLIVGERDEVVVGLNRQAFQDIPAEKRLVLIPRATHLFEEPGALEEVASQATRWFDFFLSSKNEGKLLDLL
jgi:dienelactone hydrolase